jgi:hypothetical protein
VFEFAVRILSDTKLQNKNARESGHFHFWCPEPESNRYAPFTEATDFKSVVSTYFTTRALTAVILRVFCPNPRGEIVKKGAKAPFSTSHA